MKKSTVAFAYMTFIKLLPSALFKTYRVKCYIVIMPAICYYFCSFDTQSNAFLLCLFDHLLFCVGYVLVSQ